MLDRILVRYGDLTLKGRNKKTFINAAIRRIKEKVHNNKIDYVKNHDRLYILLNGENPDPIIAALKKVSGLKSFSLVSRVDKTIEAIKEEAIRQTGKMPAGTRFKVETKRADKNFPIPSPEISKTIASAVLARHDHLVVDVHHPERTLEIEVRKEAAYIFSDVVKGLGGFPVGTMGKGVALLSGGIDSPVAAYLAMVKGIEIALVHFESTPLTSIESVQKVIDLAKTLAPYGIENKVRLHLVPFLDIHQKILDQVPEPYHITVMRRMMVRIAETFANKDHTPVLINGESVGQVASQTLESMKTTDIVSGLPILRPLVTCEKNAIIELSREIDAYDISIRPFEDCCTVYMPKSPAIAPRDYYARRYERLFDYAPMVDAAVDATVHLDITADTDLTLSTMGFTVKEALEAGE